MTTLDVLSRLHLAAQQHRAALREAVRYAELADVHLRETGPIGEPALALAAGFLAVVRDAEKRAADRETELGDECRVAWERGGMTEDDEDGCPGHESLAGEHMGEAVYCDGTCRGPVAR